MSQLVNMPNTKRLIITQDVIIALCLLLSCAVLMTASFAIREPDYGQLSPATWPRIIITVLAVLSTIYLIQSVNHARGRESHKATQQDSANNTQESSGFGDTAMTESSTETSVLAPKQSFFSYWRNVLWCFFLFFLYLLCMPLTGMLVGGVLFVFLLLNALGGISGKSLRIHALVALVTVGGMWSLFTYGLGVILPAGELPNLLR